MRLLALALLAVAAPAAARPPTFDAIRFFTGQTEGTGRLKVMLRRSHAVRVHGHGVVAPDGSLVLDQIVEGPGKHPRTRRWQIRQDAPGRYSGTLTDAVGPITGESVDGRLHLAYRTKSGIAIEQWLTLAPDGNSAANRLTARKLGVVVARLDETIKRVE